MTAKQVYFEGRVQGVGFRYTVKQVATGFEISGWVKNLADGRVEMQVVGEQDEVSSFLQEVRESALGAHIRRETVEDITPPDGVSGFSIVY